MGLFETHLRELGERVDGSFLAFAQGFDGSAEALATELSTWPTWSDVSPYPSGDVPLFKRAQIAAADLALAGIAPAHDLDRLTLFADNLVPHVLRIDGVLEFDDDLCDASTTARCSSTTRARRSRSAPSRCTPSSCSSRRTRSPPPPPSSTGSCGRAAAQPRYKAHPRHRAPTTAY